MAVHEHWAVRHSLSSEQHPKGICAPRPALCDSGQRTRRIQCRRMQLLMLCLRRGAARAVSWKDPHGGTSTATRSASLALLGTKLTVCTNELQWAAPRTSIEAGVSARCPGTRGLGGGASVWGWVSGMGGWAHAQRLHPI